MKRTRIVQAWAISLECETTKQVHVLATLSKNWIKVFMDMYIHLCTLESQMQHKILLDLILKKGAHFLRRPLKTKIDIAVIETQKIRKCVG